MPRAMSLVGIKPRLEEAKTALGQRKETNPISATRDTLKSILRIISSGMLRRPLLTSMTAEWIWRMKERSGMATRGIMVQKPKDTMHL